jgi:hypothetical protein
MHDLWTGNPNGRCIATLLMLICYNTFFKKRLCSIMLSIFMGYFNLINKLVMRLYPSAYPAILILPFELEILILLLMSMLRRIAD